MRKIYIVSVLLIFEEKILLIKSSESNSWILPSTKIILDKENPEESIIRQIKESIGFDIKIIGVNSIYFESDDSQILNTPLIVQDHFVKINENESYSLTNFTYLATLSNINGFENKTDNNFKTYHWFSKDEILNLFLRNSDKKIILKTFEIIYKSKEFFQIK